MKRRAGLFVSVALTFAAACGNGDAPRDPSPPIGSRQQAIVFGEPSPESDNSVVYIANTTQCSGTLIAPTLVLTARHCLVRFASSGAPSAANIECAPGAGQTTAVTDTLDPHPMEIYVGNKKPLGDPVAHGKEIRSAGNLDLCSNDVAILVIDTPITSVAPKAIRLDAPTIAGESVMQIGWGMDETAALPHERKQRTGVVLAVGPTQYQPPGGGGGGSQVINLPENHILTDTGGCSGDSGGPLISVKTGAVIATYFYFSPLDNASLSSPDPGEFCGKAVDGFSSLRLQKQWILDTFAREGYTPWLEGRQRPQAFGAACQDQYDCESGFCLSAGATKMCSKHCDTDTCPNGTECIGTTGNKVCAPPLVAAPPGDTTTSGCAAAPTRRPAVGAFALILAAAIVASRRRRATK